MGRMYERGTDNIFYAICNTDFQDLNRSDVPCKITLGENLCNGRGCGANSKKGKAAAEESIDEISSLFGDGSIVFIIAGMGGGTGTGAAPVIAKTAKEKGHLTIGVVTMPFSWEQENRINKAKDGLRNMLATTDAIMVFNNQQISRTYEDRPVSEGFKEADDIIASATADDAYGVYHIDAELDHLHPRLGREAEEPGYLRDRHREREMALEADLDALVVAEGIELGHAERQRHLGIVAIHRVGIEGKMDGEERESAVDRALDAPVVGIRDGDRRAPEEAMVDDKHVRSALNGPVYGIE